MESIPDLLKAESDLKRSKRRHWSECGCQLKNPQFEAHFKYVGEAGGSMTQKVELSNNLARTPCGRWRWGNRTGRTREAHSQDQGGRDSLGRRVLPPGLVSPSKVIFGPYRPVWLEATSLT
jgi:hypothetical protein